MPREFRVDVFRLDGPGVNVEERTDGTVVIHNAIISRKGVFQYRNDDGSIRNELRPSSAVFDPASMRSFEGRPFTNEHPRENISPESFKRDAAGSLGDRVYRDSVHGQDVLRVSRININDAQTILDLKNGKRELSAGYWADFDPTPGVTADGKRYDGTQVSIEGNHVALVNRGKAGIGTRLPRIHSADGQPMEVWSRQEVTDAFVDGTSVRRGDPPFEVVSTHETRAEAQAEVDALHAKNDPRPAARDAQARKRWTAWKQTKDNKEGRMPKIKHGGIEYELPENLVTPFTAITTETTKQTARADTAEGKIEALQLRITELEARPTFDAVAMQARRELERKADGHLPENFPIDTATDDDIRKAVISKRMDGLDLTDKSSAFLAGVFETIVEGKKEEAPRRPLGHRVDAAPGNKAPETPGKGEWVGADGKPRMDVETFHKKMDEQLRTIYNVNYVPAT